METGVMFQHLFLLLHALVALSTAQFVNQDPNALNLTVVKSPSDENITISYKEPRGACKTAFPTQKQYTGWVNVPGPYPANLFFWFVEARQPSQSLTIWLNGGPGSSSLFGFFAGNGPCQIVEKGLDQYDTAATDWGWDRSSNMLFIDQPNQVGFSFDNPTNGTHNFLRDQYSMPPSTSSNPLNPWALMNGTFSTQSQFSVPNTTQIAAHAVWHMLQGFLSTFPQYKPLANNPVGVNLFTESYGGRYGPIFADVWEQQNQKRATGQLNTTSTIDIQLVSLGIVNGCVDREIQIPLDPVFANSNTYGYKAISDEETKFYMNKYNATSGCGQQLRQCVSMAEASDPDDKGTQIDVNKACSLASQLCYEIESPYYAAGRSPYDLAAPFNDPNPPMLLLEYLNRGEVQQAIGARTNYTLTSNVVFSEFAKTGDIARGRTISRLASLLNKGIRVGLMYGDRDYICNWFGGEAVSLKVAAQAGGEYSTRFPAAGYSPIIVNDSYVGGVVRQFGNLSFSRIYQAGHSIAWYQPETAFQVFSRIMMGKSVSTGQDVNLKIFNTTGSANATATAKLPAMPGSTCFIRDLSGTCDDAALSLVKNGNGVVINGVLYKSAGDWPLGTKTSAASSKTTTSASTTATLTGVFTATSTPKNAASSTHLERSSFFGLFGSIALFLYL